MNTNIFKSHTMKQLAGALGGMAAAAVLYISLQNISNLNIQGLLVQPGVISDSPNQIRVNDKNIDDETLRRLAGRAQTVTKALEESAKPVVAENPVVARAEERREERQLVSDRAEAIASAPVYQMNPNRTIITEEQRLAIRAARVAGLTTPESAPYVPVPLTFDNPSGEQMVAVATVVVSEAAAAHPSASGMQSSDQLPNSGLGLNLLVLTTLTLMFLLKRGMLTSLMQDVR